MLCDYCKVLDEIYDIVYMYDIIFDDECLLKSFKGNRCKCTGKEKEENLENLRNIDLKTSKKYAQD